MQRIRKFIEASSPQKLFLFLAVPAVLLFIITIPALQGWDEATHFLRAYQVSTGDFVSERFGNRAGGPIPINVSNMNDAALTDLIHSAQSDLSQKAHIGYYKTYLKENHPDKNIVNKYFAGSAAYSPVSYAPQSVGIYIARSLRLPLLSYIYIARLFNAAIFIVLVYLAIRLAPRGKWVILAIAMLPTSLSAAASLSPDPILIASSLLLLSLFIKGLFGRTAYSLKTLISIAVLAVVVSLTKQAYFLIAFLPLLLPPRQAFGSVRRYALWNTLFIVLALGATLAWYSQINDIARYSYLDSRPNLNINTSAQETYIVHHPVNYLSTLSWEVLGHPNPQYLQMTGILTWKGIVLPQYIILLTYLGLITAFVYSRQERSSSDRELGKGHRHLASWGSLLIGLAIIVIVYTTLYVTFNPVRSTKIEGVQGRYFVPIIGLLLPAVLLLGQKSNPIMKFNRDNFKLLMFSIFIIEIIAALFVVAATNYIPNLQFV